MVTAEATATSRAQLAQPLRLLSLPDELRRLILARVPLADHLAASRVCRAFRDVIQDPNHVLVKGLRVPRFLASRLDCGFEERRIVIARVYAHPSSFVLGDLTICMAHKSGELARISRRRCPPWPMKTTLWGLPAPTTAGSSSSAKGRLNAPATARGPPTKSPKSARVAHAAESVILG